jgi:hypothetical protein
MGRQFINRRYQRMGSLDDIRSYWNWRGLHLDVTPNGLVAWNKLERYEAPNHEALKLVYFA